MRELYLVRHAIAEPRGPDWPDDTTRPLSDVGRRRFVETVRGLRALGVRLERVVSSPATRAVETAELLRRGLGVRARIVVADALSPAGAPELALKALARRPSQSVAFVGHAPEIGELAARLVEAGHPIKFKKGAVCRIDLDDRGQGHLRWFAPPKLLRTASPARV